MYVFVEFPLQLHWYLGHGCILVGHRWQNRYLMQARILWTDFLCPLRTGVLHGHEREHLPIKTSTYLAYILFSISIFLEYWSLWTMWKLELSWCRPLLKEKTDNRSSESILLHAFCSYHAGLTSPFSCASSAGGFSLSQAVSSFSSAAAFWHQNYGLFLDLFGPTAVRRLKWYFTVLLQVLFSFRFQWLCWEWSFCQAPTKLYSWLGSIWVS